MKKKTKFKTGDYSLSHVLYQKLGNDWYAFTEVDGDCFMSKVDAETAQAARNDEERELDEHKHSRRRRAA